MVACKERGVLVFFSMATHFGRAVLSTDTAGPEAVPVPVITLPGLLLIAPCGLVVVASSLNEFCTIAYTLRLHPNVAFCSLCSAQARTCKC